MGSSNTVGMLKAQWAKGKTFVSEVLREGRKVVWPGRGDVVVTSILVFVLAAISAIFLFFVDQGVIFGLQWAMGGMSHG